MPFNVNVNRDGSFYQNYGTWYSRERLAVAVPRAWIYDHDSVAILAYITEEEYNLIVARDQSLPGYQSRTVFQNVEFFGPRNRTNGAVTKVGYVNMAPIYFFYDISPSAVPGPGLMHKLMYITTSQRDYLIELDIYNADLANKIYYGPFGIPFFWSGEGSTGAEGEGAASGGAGANSAGSGNAGTGGDPGVEAFGGAGGGIAGAQAALAAAQAAISASAISWSGAAGAASLVAPGMPSSFLVDSSGSFVLDGFGGLISVGGGIPGLSYGPDGSVNYNPVYPGVFGPNSGVYNGSLSSQGNMVAMQLSAGAYRYDANNNAPRVTPWHTGYFREYWKNPADTIFGANTAMPALTGVMPDKYPDMQGSAIYYMDKMLARLSGSNDSWNNYYFINTFGQALGWTLITNNYIKSLKEAENTNLAYYGADNFQVLTTQGFNNYQVGTALVAAFRNIGNMASLITAKNNAGQPYFGTANAVAEVLIDNGLGYINDLSTNLYAAGVNFDDIGNTLYTDFITDQLRQITNAADLQTIQEVLGSNVPNIANPLDYTRIDRASGLPNDSLFADFLAVGQDFANRAPNLVLTNGGQIADLIESIQSNVTANVESLSTDNSLLDATTISQLRAFLPFSANSEPINILQVVGLASGYLTAPLREVNDGMEQLFATDYGPRIRTAFNNISRYSAFVPLTASERQQSFTWWQSQLENEIQSYYTIVDELVADTTGNIPAIVNQINSNYEIFTSNLYTEFGNYMLANIQTGAFGDNTTILSFVQSLPGYAADLANVGTDYLLYGITQDNVGGETARTVLDQGKNDNFLQQAGVTITGIL